MAPAKSEPARESSKMHLTHPVHCVKKNAPMNLKSLNTFVLAAALIFVSAIFLSGSVVAQETGTLNGTLSDPEGASFPNAHIQLRWNYMDYRMNWNGQSSLKKEKQPHKKALRVSTDSAGRFSVNLLPGTWDIFAFSDGFVPTCTAVSIQPGETTSINLRFPGHTATHLE